MRNEIDKRLNAEPGYFELARRLIKKMDNAPGVKITTCDVPEDDCVGIRVIYPDPTKIHQFWLSPEKSNAVIRAIRFHGTRLEIAIHFNV